MNLRQSAILLIFPVALFLGPGVPAQPSVTPADSTVFAPGTTAQGRVKLYQELVDWDINANLDYQLNADNEENWENAFWPMELIRYRSAHAEDKLKQAFGQIGQRSDYFTRGILEVIFANYPREFAAQVKSLLRMTRDPEIFSLCAEYLLRMTGNSQDKADMLHIMIQRFPPDSLYRNAVLRMLRSRLAGHQAVGLRPGLEDLLGAGFAPGCTVMYSFQRGDRLYPGLVVVRKPDGSFVRGNDSLIFSVPQLALSISGLPFYLTNGNTPQGIYRMNGFAVSGSTFIGPTENIQLSLPFEIPADSFFATHDPADSVWNLDRYRNLLPAGWQDYEPVYEAFYAGKAGRTAIIAHGTTIDPEYYKGEPYYPQTPSLGCLCARETWSATDGSRQESDQQKLVEAVKKAGDGTGYCVVINLDNLAKPVLPEDILGFIRNAESISR